MEGMEYIDLMTHDRKFVKEGNFSKKGKSRNSHIEGITDFMKKKLHTSDAFVFRHFFLFSDLLIYAKIQNLNPFRKHSFEFKGAIDFTTVKLENLDDTSSVKNAIHVVKKDKTYLFCLETPDDKNDIITTFQKWAAKGSTQTKQRENFTAKLNRISNFLKTKYRSKHGAIDHDKILLKMKEKSLGVALQPFESFGQHFLCFAGNVAVTWLGFEYGMSTEDSIEFCQIQIDQGNLLGIECSEFENKSSCMYSFC